MDSTNQPVRRPNPRRKRRSRFQKLVRAYFPLVLVLALVVAFIFFAVGSVRRANEKREEARQESLAQQASLDQVRLQQEQEAQALVKKADALAAGCEFDEALQLLDTFTGNPDEFDVIVTARHRYATAEADLVPIENVKTVKCLSFGTLLADASAFSGDGGDDMRYSYITGAEFTRILQGLYDNGYMLVDVYDLFTTGKNTDGTTLISINDLRLPQGKKPVMLVHTQPSGYGNKLTLSADGQILSLQPEEDGGQTGSFDFVPLLEDFIAANPGFSYKGSRAILSLTAYNGLFGYPLTETAEIGAIAGALTQKGYLLACNTFGNVAYGKISLLELVDDLSSWNVNVTPLLGQTELMVYARSSDIDDGKESYSGKKYEKLFGAGFRYYLGTCYNSNPWMDITENTVRFGRIPVNGNNLKENPSLYEGLFDPNQVLEK